MYFTSSLQWQHDSVYISCMMHMSPMHYVPIFICTEDILKIMPLCFGNNFCQRLLALFPRFHFVILLKIGIS